MFVCLMRVLYNVLHVRLILHTGFCVSGVVHGYCAVCSIPRT